MSCHEIRSELVAFHFGEISPELRASLEEHLSGCLDCVREFLELKRAIETASVEAGPSREARDRLRRAVAAEVTGAVAPRRWSWWERPAAFLFAGATVAAALLVLQLVSTGPGAVPRSLDELPQVVDPRQ